MPPPESRWWGYSVGKWVDDYTFVAESFGFDDRTWLDNAGRPHSDALRVVKTYHRALDRLSYRLQSPSFDIPEQECVPSETAKYNKLFANPAAGIDDTPK